MDICVTSIGVLMNKDALYSHTCLGTHIYAYLKYIPRTKIADMFKFRKCCQNISQNDYINLHSDQLCMRDPIAPHLHKSLILSLRNLAILWVLVLSHCSFTLQLLDYSSG